MSLPVQPSDAAEQVVDRVRAWLPEWLELTLAQKCEDGRWFVLIEDFDITGMGATLEDARRDALQLLGAYLGDHFKDGTPFDETFRHIPLRLKLEVRGGTLLHHIVRAIGPREAKEYKILVPPSALNGVCA